MAAEEEVGGRVGFWGLMRGGGVTGATTTYHVLLAFLSFLISLVAHWLSVFVLLVLDRRPWVRRSLIGSTSNMLSMLAP